MKYDGSINIDTKIDEKGFNDGVKSIDRSMKSASKSLTKGIDTKAIARKFRALGGVLKGVFAALGNAILIGLIVGVGVAIQLFTVLVGLASALIGIIVAVAGAFLLFTNVMFKGMSMSSYLYNDFKNMNQLFLDLKSSIYAAFAPLWLAVAPTVIKIVNWLIEMANILAQVLATLFGQSTYMRYVAGSAKQVQGATGGIKKDMEDAEKATKGALAAFDEINVLRQDEPIEEPAVGSGGTGLGQMGEFVETPVDEGIAAKVEEIKQKVKEAWEAITTWWEDTKQRARDAWDSVVETWGNIKLWWQENVSGPVKESLSGAWEAVKQGFASAWQYMVGLWRGFTTWIRTNITDPFITHWDQTWAKWKVNAYLAWLELKATWIRAKIWINEKFLTPLKESFATTWDKIKESFTKAWEKLPDVIKGFVNKIIDYLNSLIGKAESALNGLINAVNSMGSIIPGWSLISPVSIPKIPKLADGAVIPPNSSFLAMLGDQRSGRNLEAPEDLIRQIVREEAGANQNVTINFAGSMGALVREMKPYIDRESTRVGNSLIKGATT